MVKIKRIASIIGVILILSLYIISLISAITASKYANSFFTAALFSTVVIPVMLYAFTLIYKLVHRNDNKVNPYETVKQGKKDDQDKSNKPQ